LGAVAGGGSKGLVSLARLAVESGGRFTENTNDLALGFARAQRDQACVYSVGFYEHDPKEDQAQPITIRVRPAGLHVVYPSAYIVRSSLARKQSLLRAAFFSPETFETGVVRAHVFPIRPASKDSWEGLLAVSFPVSLASAGGRTVEREFGGVLSNSAGAVHQFSRTIRLEPKSEDVASEPLVTFLEPVELRPGKYSLTTVLSDAAAVAPHAAKVECDVPAIPKAESFLVGPILGRRAGKDVVVRSAAPSGPGPHRVVVGDTIGDWNSFDPLLVQEVDDPTDLVVMTFACVAGDKHGSHSRTVLRRFRTADGQAIGSLDPVTVEIEKGSGIQCQMVLDVLPSRSIKQGGDYLFDAALAPASGRDPDWSAARFSVGAARQGGEATAPEGAGEVP
jgi:hypothetical protein